MWFIKVRLAKEWQKKLDIISKENKCATTVKIMFSCYCLKNIFAAWFSYWIFCTTRILKFTKDTVDRFFAEKIILCLLIDTKLGIGFVISFILQRKIPTLDNSEKVVSVRLSYWLQKFVVSPQNILFMFTISLRSHTCSQISSFNFIIPADYYKLIKKTSFGFLDFWIFSIDKNHKKLRSYYFL